MLDLINHRFHALIGSFLIVFSIFFSSYATNFSTFVLFFSFFVGFGYGILYMLTLKTAWQYFPKRKGMIGGIVLSCYSFGAIAWSFLTALLANPNNDPPNQIVAVGNTFELLYSEDSLIV